MQAALLRGKCEGIAKLERLDRLTSKEVSLADVLIGRVWTDTKWAERARPSRN
jgi:hypothetical protein